MLGQKDDTRLEVKASQKERSAALVTARKLPEVGRALQTESPISFFTGAPLHASADNRKPRTMLQATAFCL